MTQAGSHHEPSPKPGAKTASPPGAIDEVEVRGHIVDSLLLPKILDRILQMGGKFEIHECRIGVRRVGPELRPDRHPADTPEMIDAILGDLVEHGASPVHPGRATRRRPISRGLPRGLLQHHQPANPGAAQRPLDRSARPGDGLRHRGRSCNRRTARCVPMTDVSSGCPSSSVMPACGSCPSSGRASRRSSAS